jgi:choline dehydrogenase-like flavoprotein
MPLGRGVGGGTTINGLQYVRGSPQDFDYWASLGNEGWDFQSVLPYFRKSEDFRGKITPETGMSYFNAYFVNALTVISNIEFYGTALRNALPYKGLV